MSLKKTASLFLLLSVSACSSTSNTSEGPSPDISNQDQAVSEVNEVVTEASTQQMEMEEKAEAVMEDSKMDSVKVAEVKEIDPSVLIAPLPTIKRGLSPVSLKYATTISFGEEKLDIDMTATVSELDNLWKVTSLSTGAIGEVHDECHIDKTSYESKYRMMKQGPSVLELNYDGAKATGKTVSGTNESEVSADLEGPAFCSGPAMPFTIASLDLVKGYKDSFRVFNPGNKSTSYMMVDVVGEESLTVDAGTFDTVEVKVTFADGSPGAISLWVDKASPMVVKSLQSMPHMGGAVMETVLKLVE